MEYISVKEASEKWKLSIRIIQKYCKEGRIQGVKRYGRSWMIPLDTKRPLDLRKTASKSNKDNSYLTCVSLTSSIKMPKSNPYIVLDSISDKDIYNELISEFAYFSGDYENAKKSFFDIKDEGVTKICSCTSASSAAITMGDYVSYNKITDFLNHIIKDSKDIEIKKTAQIILSIGYLGMMAPNMASDFIKKGDFSKVNKKNMPFAIYAYIKYLQGIKEYKQMKTACKVAISFTYEEERMTIIDIYLRIMCAVSYVALNDKKKAKVWLLEAMDMALPHGFISPFSENIVPLQGLIEECISEYYPKYYDKIMYMAPEVWKNWMKCHNKFAKDNITLILSLREYQIATYLANDMSYREVAKRMNISNGRLNNIISEIYEKLMINNKKELSNLIY